MFQAHTKEWTRKDIAHKANFESTVEPSRDTNSSIDAPETILSRQQKKKLLKKATYVKTVAVKFRSETDGITFGDVVRHKKNYVRRKTSYTVLSDYGEKFTKNVTLEVKQKKKKNPCTHWDSNPDPFELQKF